MAKRKLIVGKKNNIKLPFGIVKGRYYIDKCYFLCWELYDCCDKEHMNRDLFMKPVQNASYEECLNGKFKD